MCNNNELSFSLNLIKYSLYLLIFISSKAASISSNIQKEDGLVSKIAKSKATAVKDLSPPDNKFKL